MSASHYSLQKSSVVTCRMPGFMVWAECFFREASFKRRPLCDDDPLQHRLHDDLSGETECGRLDRDK